ncbi:hypothetical protein C8J56DRAFT_783942 [Mycena floridula]|nr:hypothetical protein C8J56DRAFT_783942 [Mycena floridula]
MSTSRAEDIYELQNDRRLEELHSKIRILPAIQITTSIHDHVERHNLLLDDSATGQVFGINDTVKTWRIAMYVVLVFIGLWVSSKIFWWWRPMNSEP